MIFITKSISAYNSINSVNPLYFIIGEEDGYNTMKKKFEIDTFASTGKNKEVLKKYTELWYKIKYLIKK